MIISMSRTLLRNNFSKSLCKYFSSSTIISQPTVNKPPPAVLACFPELKHNLTNDTTNISNSVSLKNTSTSSAAHKLNICTDLCLFGPHVKVKILDIPVRPFDLIQLPSVISVDTTDSESEVKIDAPSYGKIIEKQAARLIVIRRRKMKKHKLRKLRKKMKFEWAKVRQRREMRKEKTFQAELLAQIKVAEAFDAAAYVGEKLRKATEVPHRWKGKQLPESVVNQKLGTKS